MKVDGKNVCRFSRLSHGNEKRLCRLFAAGTFVMLISNTVNSDTIDTTGQEPYEQCGYCHEYDGNTRMPSFPRLAGQWPDYLRKQLHDFRIGKRLGQMTATAELLSDEDIEAVVNYFSAQAPRRLPLDPQQKTEQMVAHQLFTKGDRQRGLTACSVCHGDDGNGRMGFPGIAGQQPDYLMNQLRAFKAAERTNDIDAQMRKISASLSDVEINALAGYLARLEAKQVGLSVARGDSVAAKKDRSRQDPLRE